MGEPMTDDQRARELLAAEYEAAGRPGIAACVLAAKTFTNEKDNIALRAITRALALPPAAQPLDTSHRYQARGLCPDTRPGFSAVVDDPIGWPCCHCTTMQGAEELAALLNFGKAAVSAKLAVQSGQEERVEWKTADGTRPSLVCRCCQNRVPILSHGLCDECRPPAAQPVDEDELVQAERFGNAEYRKACARPIATILDILTLGDRAALEAYANAEFWAGKLCGLLASRPTQGRKVREALEDCRDYFRRHSTRTPEDGQVLLDKINAALSTPLDPPEATSFEAGRVKGLEEAMERVKSCEIGDPSEPLNGAQEANLDGWNHAIETAADKVNDLIHSAQGGAEK